MVVPISIGLSFVPLQLGAIPFTIVTLLVLALAVVTVWQMVEIVDAYEKEALSGPSGDRFAV